MRMGVEWRKFGVRGIFVLGVVVLRAVAHTEVVTNIDWWVGNLYLAIGWTVGYFLSDLDDWIYVLGSHPHELTSQRARNLLGERKWAEARELLVRTREERVKLPIHNVATGFLVGILGLWVITSSGSLLGAGVVLGISFRLWLGLVKERDYHRWYWLFSREFPLSEHKLVVAAWGLVVVWLVFLATRA